MVYDNPLDNVGDLAHIFFQRCLEANIVPYVVTKKTPGRFRPLKHRFRSFSECFSCFFHGV